MLISSLRRLWARVFLRKQVDISLLQEAADAARRSAESKVRRHIV